MAYPIPITPGLSCVVFTQAYTAGREHSRAGNHGNCSSYGAPYLGAVHFDTDKATLTPQGQATLTRAAAYLKQNPSAHMRIVGYTDATGAAQHNADLSQQRALAAAHYMEDQGIDRSRLTGGGFADQKPVGSNGTEAGKADNRRVEIFTQK